jgi:hypothetical protein
MEVEGVLKEQYVHVHPHPHIHSAIFSIQNCYQNICIAFTTESLLNSDATADDMP